MTRDRFFKVRNALKVVIDGDITADEKKADRLWKVKPFIESVRNACFQLQRSEFVSIDEQMVPFSGACPSRQYVPNKPNPIGIKNFVAATADGLVLDFEVYQGAEKLQSQVCVNPHLDIINILHILIYRPTL